MVTKILIAIVVLSSAFLFTSESVLALDYPTRDIDWICGFSPGSVADAFARVASKYGEKYVGRPIVVVNKPAAGGAQGLTQLANAKPDGYTIGGIANSIFSQPHLIKAITYTRNSFRPICEIARSTTALFVKKGGPCDIPFKELLKKMKENADTLKIAMGGKWSIQDFVYAVFLEQSNVKLIKVSFPATGEAHPALLGGYVDMEIGSEWGPMYKGGKLSIKAISPEERNPEIPDIPTFREFGLDVTLNAIHWVDAPGKLPDPIVNYLVDVFKKGFAEPGFKEAIT